MSCGFSSKLEPSAGEEDGDRAGLMMTEALPSTLQDLGTQVGLHGSYQVMKRGHGFADVQFSFHTSPWMCSLGPVRGPLSGRPSTCWASSALACQGTACVPTGMTSPSQQCSQPASRGPCLGPHTLSDLGISVNKKNPHKLQICQENSYLRNASNS